MRASVGRAWVAAACLLWLAGCETTSKLGAPSSLDSLFPGRSGDVTGSTPAQADATEVTGSTDGVPQPPGTAPPGASTALWAPPATPEVLGKDPNDDLSVAKKYFRQGSYGVAERHFRKAVERHPRDAEAWLGLAASYDRLRRFDLADRAYAQVIRLVGPTAEVLNNQGFSYMLRGDYRRARATLLAALERSPGNPYVRNNLRLLEQTARKAKAVN